MALQIACALAHRRVGNYWHLLPKADQARLVIWNAINPHTGKRRITEVFPRELVAGRLMSQQMIINLKCGSSIQLGGTDNYDTLVGATPVGITFSEQSRADPGAWSVLRPILAENGGYALFISTPAGNNHFKTLYDYAVTAPGWFAELLPATKTSVFTEYQLALEKAEYIAQYGAVEGMARFNTEYMCDFDVPVVGAVFGQEMHDVLRSGRIGNFPWDPRYQVITAWDLGIGHRTAIWCFQIIDGIPRFIDFVQGFGASLDHYVRQLRERPYLYGVTILPHDGRNKELMQPDGLRRADYLRRLGMSGIKVLDRVTFDHRKQATVNLIRRAQFNEATTKEGLDCLRSYHYSQDERRKDFSVQPVDDWSTDAADAFGYAALGEQYWCADDYTSAYMQRLKTQPKLRVV